MDTVIKLNENQQQILDNWNFFFLPEIEVLRHIKGINNQ